MLRSGVFDFNSKNLFILQSKLTCLFVYFILFPTNVLNMKMDKKMKYKHQQISS